jgi:hypothetical protein
MPVKRIDRENPIQRAIVDYLRVAIPGNPIIHHSPNEIGLSGANVARQISKAKFNGMLPGFPDLILICHAGVAFFEVKAEGNGLTPAQQAVHLDLKRMGHRIAVVRSIVDVQEALDGWAIWTNDRPYRRAAE